METTLHLHTLLILVVLAVAVASPNQEYNKHMQSVLQFKCGEPQPRAVLVNTIHPLPSEDLYYPLMTVLHVCDRGSGCCPQGERFECSPEKTEDVELVFRVTKIFGGKQRRGVLNSHFETLTFKNHTSCSCQEIIDLPK